MRSLEYSRNRGIDQDHVADDRRNIETRKHDKETTWDDVAELKDQMNQLKSLIDELPGIDDVNESAETDTGNQAKEQAVVDAREQVLNVYSDKSEVGIDKSSRSTALEDINKIRLSDNELIELTAEWGRCGNKPRSITSSY